ncbi:Zn(II)2Cys6 transcription factor (Eurofung) [Fusarium mexicanum]|uniref:Zn(II)2Cys6 transcription factor (Eurofung) n=1 Tax=Fusarium mexicanum TaxID=751941 RepID=A0A8H5IEU7_9HYPO|nr:Zn(II)2Cys6 transcription factor (Eurofung) [Fusarium mexicanum]
MPAQQPPPFSFRKGTKSCTECRRRKIRCVRIPEDSPTCRQCVERNTSCLAQVSKSRTRQAQRLSSRYRITQLESQVTQLTKTINDIQAKLGGESILHLEQQIDQSPVSDGSDDESTNSEGLIAEESSDFRSLFHNDILSSDTGQQHEQISERRTKVMVSLCERVRPALQRLIPSKEETAEMLVVTFDWLQMLASLLPQPAAANSNQALLARYDDMCRPDVDVVELASWLLTVAITAQQIPQESRDMKPQSLGSSRRLHFSRAVSDAIETLVLSNDRLVGNIPGLGLGLHFVRLLMGRGDLQGAWLKLRHFIALGELMALPKAVQLTRSKTVNGLLDEDTAKRAQVWELMCTVDRLVGMFVNLPPYTRRSSNMASLLPIMSDGAVQTSVYLSRLMDIAAEGHGLDDPSGMQGSKPSSYAASLSVAHKARALFSETPESWWVINTENDLKPDHIVQFVHHCTVMKAYLPIVHRQERSQDYGYSRLACIDAFEKVAQMYQFIRRKLPSGFFSLNVLDLQAFTAVILLLLLSHSSPFPEVHSFQINKSGLEAVVSQVILLMEEKSNTVLGSDFARRGAHTIRSLHHLLQQDESAGSSMKEMTVNVPLIGKIRVRRNTQHSLNLTAHSQESSIQGPQVGHWSLEEQVTPTLCSSQLNTGTSPQNSANNTSVVPDLQWDQFLWSVEDSGESALDDFIFRNGFDQASLWLNMF